MQTLRKKTSPCKYRNDPGRFFGDGVTFKAKLIGILEVGEARGDRMCQEALQDLKMAIRAAGEHKQRITIHVTIDGLRLRDEKTGDSLYHHPVHKISFIAQDMTDSRAFGYIFGSPDSGHRFFGIKTDKAASQVVLAMRDLFQVVFELKKKEIELARQQIQSKSVHDHQPMPLLISSGNKSNSNDSTPNLLNNKNSDGAKTMNKEANLMSPESVADLVDLEQELSSIQRGITQMERITPSEPTPTSKNFGEEDPFGDSFTNFPTYNLLPPPESSRSRHSKPTKPPDNMNASIESSITNNLTNPSRTQSPPLSTLLNSSNTTTSNLTTNIETSENWLTELENVDVFKSETANATKNLENITNSVKNNDETQITSLPIQIAKSDAFTDLDPLGTGKIKPYVDKKYFFHELKNPPKKVLKDLSTPGASNSKNNNNNININNNNGLDINNLTTSTSVSGSVSHSISPANEQQHQPMQQQNNGQQLYNVVPTSNSIPYNNLGTVTCNTQHQTTTSISNINVASSSVSDIERVIATTSTTTAVSAAGSMTESTVIAHDTDPFSPTRKKSDPFQDGDIFSKLDPFEFEFAKSNILPDTKITNTLNEQTRSNDSTSSPSVFNGPLQVSLPPESWGTNTVTATSTNLSQSNIYATAGIVDSSLYGQRIQRQSSESPNSATARNRPSVFKQNTVDVISSISTKKMPPLFGHKFSKRDSHSINMRRLQESDSLSENETAPEPPPRPDSSGFSIEPPPLPPKKQFSDIVIRPRITSSSAVPPPTRYDYVQAKMKSSQLSSIFDSNNSGAPPIPLPSRRIGRSDSSYPGPGRPRKPGCDEDDYLAPLPTGRSEVPPIIAPPPQSNKSGRPRRQEIVETKNYDTNQVNKQTSNLPLNPIEFEPEAILPDITLSQLLTLGVEDLAKKLNVPASKLSTMTLVELTTYLSEFIEASKKRQQQQLQEIQTQQLQQNQQQHQKISAPISSKPAVNKAIGTNISLGSSPPIFKVNFDQNSDATFIAKFDDNFGDESSLNQSSTFVANFSQFENIKPESMASSAVFASGSGSLQNYAPPVKSIPPADRYAVFREIIDQDLKNDSSTEIKSSPEEEDEEFYDDDEENSSPIQQQKLDNEYSDDEKMQTVSVTQPIQTKIIDTKITEAISHAKDRYAALRDIILVENLFEKPKTLPQHSDSFSGFTATFGENNFTEPSQVKPSETIFADDSFPTNFETALDEMTNRDESTENDVENDKGESNIQAELEDKDHLEERLPSTGSSPDSNQNYDSDKLKGEDSELHKPEDNILDLQKENGNTSSLMQTLNVSSNKDDVEIDELMNRAISNLSLDSRDHLSPKTPAIIKSPIINDNIELASSPVNQLQSDRQQIKSPLNNVVLSSKFNDVSTSPIPIQKSPQTVPGILSVSDVAKNIEKSPSQLTINSSTAKSPSLKSPLSRSPMGQQNISNGAMNIKKKTSKEESSEWAVFDKSSETRENSSAPGTIGQSQPQRSKGSKTPAAKDVVGESPCSSDGKDDWKTAGINRQGLPPESICSNKRWPKGQTSSSSRDLSPWDDEAPNEYKKRQVVHPIPDRHGYYMRHSRRMNSCDDDYEYEEEMAKRRERKIKSGISKSRDNFDFDSPSWYQSGTMHHSWSPQDDDDRERSFERGVYERSSYGGPMYDKHKHVPHSSYDRRIAYDKRGKYYREYCRPTDYEFESYGECPEVKDRKMMYSRRDYENVYDDGGFTRGGIAPDNNNTVGRNSGSGIYKSREYFYSGTTERRSFDRESIDSYESGGRRRKSFGSGDVYGSFDSREDFRERYMADKTRQIRKGIKPRGPASLSGGPPDEYEQDSETDMQVRREPREYSRSLQRPSSGSRIRKSSGSSPWDGEEGPTHAQKGHWKRPASASESERRLTAENRRVLSHNQSGGSDGEKERRFRKKQRQRGKEGSEIRPSLPTGRYPSAGSHRENYDYVYDDYERNVTTQSPIPGPPVDEDKFERLNRRRMDLNQRMIDMEHRKRNTSGSVTAEKYSYEDEDYEDDDDDAEATKSAPIQKYSMSKKDSYYSEKDIRYSRTPKFGSERFDFDADFEETPHSTSSGRNKFNFDDQVGFESDFISSPPPSGQLPPSATSSIATKTPISAGTKSSFRFSNDFSGKQSLSSNFGDGEFPNSNSTSSMQQVTPTTASTQKLRFDDKVTISKFDHNQPSSSSGGVGNISSSIGDAFEDDDFSKAQFDFENESQWSSETPIKRNNNLRSSGKNRGGINSNSAIDSTTQHDHLRKSESVNIFAKKTEDPFEDDDFFKNVENNSISHDSSNGKKHGNIEVSLSNGGSNINNGNNNMTNTCKKDSFQWDNDFAKFDENM
ncbi:protein disabled isoform X2 [Condylostylus longicornis]|uniref:protein disabled isoform X2 n=1 Tax=Condylostylus longicornis TaxID=2530218 RepID=UPI00244E1AA1|nr:protein disabled isoform X2 [Condylostylus longicornis]